MLELILRMPLALPTTGTVMLDPLKLENVDEPSWDLRDTALSVVPIFDAT